MLLQLYGYHLRVPGSGLEIVQSDLLISPVARKCVRTHDNHTVHVGNRHLQRRVRGDDGYDG